MPPVDFEAAKKELAEKIGREPSHREVLSWLLYDRVFEDYAAHQEKHADTSILPTPAYLYGLEPGEEIGIDIEQGKRLLIKFLTLGEPHPDGNRTVFFDLNGQPRNITVADAKLESQIEKRVQADPNDPNHVAAPMPGLVVVVAVQPGDKVKLGQKLVTMEAMKMETTLYAEKEGKVAEVLVKTGSQVETNDLVVRLE